VKYFLLNHPGIRVIEVCNSIHPFTSVTMCLAYCVLCCERKSVPNISCLELKCFTNKRSRSPFRTFLFFYSGLPYKLFRTSLYFHYEHPVVSLRTSVKIIQFLAQKCVCRCRSEHPLKIFTNIRLFIDDRSEHPYVF
jgi:hypothetical protein